MKINEEWYQYPNNLVDLFEDSFKKFKDRPWIGKKDPSGDYDFKTYGELGTRIDNLRGGMAQLGIQKDVSVGLIINNSIEWAVIAFATYGLGMFIGTWFAGRTIDMLTFDGIPDWTRIWYVPAMLAAVVLLVFVFLFKEQKKAS